MGKSTVQARAENFIKWVDDICPPDGSGWRETGMAPTIGKAILALLEQDGILEAHPENVTKPVWKWRHRIGGSIDKKH